MQKIFAGSCDTWRRTDTAGHAVTAPGARIICPVTAWWKGVEGRAVFHIFISGARRYHLVIAVSGVKEFW